MKARNDKPSQAPKSRCIKIKLYPAELSAEPIYKEFECKTSANLWVLDVVLSSEAAFKHVLYHYGKNEDCQDNEIIILTSSQSAPESVETKIMSGHDFHNIMLCNNIEDAIAVCNGWLEPYPENKRTYRII